MSAEQRLRIALEMTDLARQFARTRIRNEHPESPQQLPSKWSTAGWSSLTCTPWARESVSQNRMMKELNLRWWHEFICFAESNLAAAVDILLVVKFSIFADPDPTLWFLISLSQNDLSGTVASPNGSSCRCCGNGIALSHGGGARNVWPQFPWQVARTAGSTYMTGRRDVFDYQLDRPDAKICWADVAK